MASKATDKQTMEKKPPAGASGPARGLAFVLALVLVLAMPLALLAFDVWRVVFNPPLVKAFVTDEAVNSDLIPAALTWFSAMRAQQRVASGESLSGVDEPDVVLLLSYLELDDWRNIKTEVLTDEFLTHLVSVTVDGTYGWMDSADRVPQITWELQPFIDRVNSEHGVNAITIAYDKLPPCTEAEINDFLTRLGRMPPGVEILYNLCEFPSEWQGSPVFWHDDQFTDYENALDHVVANVPPQFDLTDQLSQMADQGGVGPEALKQQLRLIRLAGMLAWLVPVALVLLIAALAVRSLRTFNRWVGTPLLVGGFITLLPGLAYRPLVTALLAAGALSEVPASVVAEATRVITRLADEIFGPLLIEAVVIMGVAVGLIGLGLLGKRQSAAQEETK